MRYGIYADIHGNLDAAKVVLEYLKHKVDALICVGDIVGYGAEPNQCIELVENSTSTIIAGNHDWASVGLMDINYFNPYAKQAILWTRGELTDSHKDFLTNLKLVFSDKEDITIVHGSLDEPSIFRYIFNSREANETFRRLNTQVCFIGHTHIPIVFCKQVNSQDYPVTESIKGESRDIKLDSKFKYVINVGSVGQPRDGDPRACFVIYDSDKKSVHFERIVYPVKIAQKKIVDAGLPSILASRLQEGY